MKYLKTTIIGIFLGSVLVAGAATQIYTSKNSQNPQNLKTIADTATTTRSIATQFTHFVEAEFLTQGVCVKIKDSDGIGYTYLSVNNGAGYFSSLSCE